MKNKIVFYGNRFNKIYQNGDGNHLYCLGNSDFLNCNKSSIKKFDKFNKWSDLYNPCYNFYLENLDKLNDWQEYYDSIDVSFLKDYKILYYFCIKLYDILDIKKQNHYNYKDLHHRDALKFQGIGKEIANVATLVKASSLYKIPLLQYNFEVGGIDLRHLGFEPYGYRRFHGYKYGTDIEYLSSYQYFYIHNNDYKSGLDNFFDNEDKVYDFVFCGSYQTNHCPNKMKDFEELKNELLNKFNKTFCRIVCADDNDRSGYLPHDEYWNLIKQSKYSFIATSYLDSVFAIDRFVRCIFYDCLPIIGNYVDLKYVNETFDYDFDKLKLKYFKQPNETERINLLKEIKQVFIDKENTQQVFGEYLNE